MAQTTFERVEKKYKLSATQYQALTQAMQDRMRPDEYGAYTIANIYYDTETYALIRSSLGKPIYKEKVRMRSYGVAQKNSDVFVEIKKKYDGVVYKRREVLPHMDAKRLIGNPTATQAHSQIMQEICFVARQYDIAPKAYISYDRKAFVCNEDEALRVTFDSNLLFRQENLRLDSAVYGAPLLGSGEVVMEIKVPGAFPLWMSRLLSALGIFPASFSKYGVAYETYILPQQFISKGVAKGA